MAASRRDFLIGSAAVAATASLAWKNAASAAGAEPATATASAGGKPLSLYKAVKWDMVGGDLPVLDRFQLCRDLGYDGMELISPAPFSAREVRDASEKTGMPVHGLVDMKHWDVRLSSPDPKVRDEGVQILKKAIADAHDFGGFTVLLVPGRVSGPDETHDDVWKRSIEGIRQVIPDASKCGVRVLVETVWNGFCETPEQMRDYLDEIASPSVASYMDFGNMLKFAPCETWIRTLGPRIVKLDVKDWSESAGFCKIGDGAVDWPGVRQALAEIGYSGWCTAEVEGGDREALADIAARMDRVLVKAPA